MINDIMDFVKKNRCAVVLFNKKTDKQKFAEAVRFYRASCADIINLQGESKHVALRFCDGKYCGFTAFPAACYNINGNTAEFNRNAYGVLYLDKLVKAQVV